MIGKEYKSEDQLLADCFMWFWNVYPYYRGLLFHPANELPRGGRIGALQRSQMKSKGVVSGIPDLVYMGGRCAGIELKLTGRKPTDAQLVVARDWVEQGRDFFFLDTKDDFMKVMLFLTSSDYPFAAPKPQVYNLLSRIK